MNRTLLNSLLGAVLVSISIPILGQQSHEAIEEVVVLAHPLSGEGLSQASTVLAGEELERKLAANIGATLAQEPGIHSAQFGNAVGRPVIHGLSGPRVRIMEDRIDALDLSVTSADHAVTIEPFVADRIEVLKGSSTLLYGSGAIGGVVDVHTARIPHVVPSQLYGGIETRFDTNTNGNTTSAKANGGSGSLAWHVDGTKKDGDDYEIPGFAESARLRALDATEDNLEVRGILPGSHFDVESYAAGGSYVGDWGFVGASVSRLDADYGLPGGHAMEGIPSLAAGQTRTDFELGVKNPFANFTSLNIRLGVNDYEHREIEPSGEVATDFSNEAWELRGELVYEHTDWKGVSGIQHMDREFSAIGEEAFVPPVDTEDSSLFWVAERDFDRFDLELGLRVGRVAHEPAIGASEDFTTYAASMGLVVSLGESWRLGLRADQSSRAPVSEELFSNGPHLVTNAFEIGDPTLKAENATNLSMTLNYLGESWKATVTTYHTQFSDFIYEQASETEMDGLPVFQFRQDDATFFGLDAQVSTTVAHWDGGRFNLRGMFDYVDAELDVRGNNNLPRIPPLRYGLGIEGLFGSVTASIDYIRVDVQDHIADGELKSDAYDDLRAYLGAEFALGQSTIGVFLSGKNLTDDEQRYHTSFVKEFVPAPGRTIEAGIRFLF